MASARRLALRNVTMTLPLVLALAGCATQAAQPGVTPMATLASNIASKNPTSAATPAATPTNVLIAGTPGVYGPTCQTAQLSLTTEPLGAAMGNVGEWGRLTNHSTTACSLYGFPGARLLDARRNPMTVRVHWQTSAYLYSLAAQRVQLAPGASAYFVIETTDVPSGSATSCPVSSYLDITPPNDVSALTVADKIDDCDGNLYISPVEPNQRQFIQT